jgi:hypothetical protein
MNSEWFINSIILKEIKYRLNIQFIYKALYNKFIVLLTSRLLQTNSYNDSEWFGWTIIMFGENVEYV